MLVVLQGPERGYKQKVKQLEFSRDGTQLYAGITKEQRGKPDIAQVRRLILNAPNGIWDVLKESETPCDIALTEMRCFPKGYGTHQMLVIDGRWKYAFDKRGEMTWFTHDINLVSRTYACFFPWERALIEYRGDWRLNNFLRQYDFHNDPPTETELALINLDPSDSISRRMLSPSSINGRRTWFILGTFDGLLVGWIEDFVFHTNSEYHHPGEFIWTSFSKNGHKIIGVCGLQVLIWEHLVSTSNENPIRDVRSALLLKGHQQRITDTALLPDGRRIMTASLDNTVRIWDIETGEELERYDWGIGPVRSVAISPDGAIAAAGGDGENQIVIWDLE